MSSLREIAINEIAEHFVRVKEDINFLKFGGVIKLEDGRYKQKLIFGQDKSWIDQKHMLYQHVTFAETEEDAESVSDITIEEIREKINEKRKSA